MTVSLYPLSRPRTGRLEQVSAQNIEKQQKEKEKKRKKLWMISLVWLCNTFYFG